MTRFEKQLHWGTTAAVAIVCIAIGAEAQKEFLAPCSSFEHSRRTLQIAQLEDQLAAKDADCAVLQNTIDPLYADVSKMRVAVAKLTATVRHLAELMDEALVPATE